MFAASSEGNARILLILGMLRFIVLLITSSLLLSCSSGQAKQKSKEKQSYTMEYARHIRTVNDDSITKIGIYNPDNDKLEQIIASGGLKNQKIISLSATINGMISILDCRDLLVGVSNGSELYDPELIADYKSGKIQAFGDEGSYSIEKIVASGANIILYSGFNREFPNEPKLKQLGITMIPIYDWREDHPLGKAEWIKLIGLICGREKEALLFYNNLKKKYLNLQALTDTISDRPTVISGNLLGDIWYAPVGDSYMAKIIDHAGGEYVYQKTKGTGSLSLSIEKILQDNANTRYWINPGMDSKNNVLKMNPHAKHLAGFNNLYCYSANMNKYWERSAAEPHLVLSDLIKIFHPTLLRDESLHFYTKLK